MGWEPPGMVTIERPCCEAPLIVEAALAVELRCDACAVTWTVSDPEPSAAGQGLIAALAA